MDLYQLKIFFLVCNSQSFTKGAKRLFISQSAVSISIKKLEKSIGFKLFDRSTKKLKRTLAGDKLFKTCNRIFYELEQAGEQLELMKKEPEIQLSIGAPVEFGNTVLIKIVRKFIESNPEIAVSFHFSKNLLNLLLQDELDIIIDCKKHSHKLLTETFLFRERYVCAAAPEFLKKNAVKNIYDLKKSTLLSCDSELKWWDNFFKAAPDDLGLDSCLRILKINHIKGLINATIEGYGIGFFPLYTVAEDLKSGALQQIFKEIMPLDDNFSIYQKANRASLKYQSRLVEYLTGLNPEQIGF